MRRGLPPSLPIVAWLLLGGSLAAAEPMDQEFFTDFTTPNFADASSFEFNGASFSGGDAFFVGVSALYNGDFRAWDFGPGSAGTIELDPAAAEVEFLAVGLDGATVEIVGMVDEGLVNGMPAGGTVVDVTGSDVADHLLKFTGEITRIEFENTSDETAGDFANGGASIDDFGFTPLPAPGAAASGAAALLALAGLGRWRGPA